MAQECEEAIRVTYARQLTLKMSMSGPLGPEVLHIAPDSQLVLQVPLWVLYSLQLGLCPQMYIMVWQ